MTTTQDFADRFAGHLARLAAREDRGALAALRRGLGKPPGTAAEMFPYVAPLLGREPYPARERAAYLVASLFGSHPASAHGGQPFTDALARTDRSESYERRIVRLLGSDAEDIGDQLRHCVAFLRAQGVPVDWAQLLRDLENWDHPDRWVQRRWAKAYWGTHRDQDNDAVVTAAANEMGGPR
jgi:CRISPR system Cascade subunit CasB